MARILNFWLPQDYGRKIMKTLKGWITTTAIAFVLTCFAATANGSIIIGGLSSPDPCSEPTKVSTSHDLGSTVIGGLTSVIIGGLTSIVVGGFIAGDSTKSAGDLEPAVNCSIIVGG